MVVEFRARVPHLADRAGSVPGLEVHGADRIRENDDLESPAAARRACSRERSSPWRVRPGRAAGYPASRGRRERAARPRPRPGRPSRSPRGIHPLGDDLRPGRRLETRVELGARESPARSGAARSPRRPGSAGSRRMPVPRQEHGRARAGEPLEVAVDHGHDRVARRFTASAPFGQKSFWRSTTTSASRRGSIFMGVFFCPRSRVTDGPASASSISPAAPASALESRRGGVRSAPPRRRSGRAPRRRGRGRSARRGPGPRQRRLVRGDPAPLPSATAALRARPSRRARLSGLPRRLSRYAVSSSARSPASGGCRPGPNAASAVAGARRFQGQTSWHTSQPKARRRRRRGARRGIGPRCSIVRYEMHRRASST